MRYNSFIQEHRDVTMSGTKRYEDKSGEYYLQNLDKYQKNYYFNQRSITSLNLNSNNKNFIKYCNTNYNSNKHIIKVKKKKLFNELVPIPIKHKNKLKNDIEKKNLANAIGNAKYIRRYQYSNNIIQQNKENQKIEQIFFNKVKFIQIWWKTIFQIIKIQKYLRGYLYRTKLISLLDKREKYIDRVLNIIKCIKKIFINKFIKCLVGYESNKKYYFYKWNNISNKKKIIKKLLDNYSSYKIFQEYNYNHNLFTTKTLDNNNEDDEIDFDTEFFKISKKNNKSLIDIYNNNTSIKKRKKGKNLSQSSYMFNTRKRNLNIGIELSSSSQIINRPKRNRINEINKTNDNNNNNKRGSLHKINNRINIFEHLKTFHKRNKSNNNQLKNNKNRFDNSNSITTSKFSIREKYPKEKSFSDLKSINTNYNYRNTNSNTNIFFKNNNSKNQDLTKSLQLNSLKNKNQIKKKKKKKNIGNHNTSNLLLRKKQKKKKKIKVYENELDEYNKKLNLEKNNQNENANENENKNDKNDIAIEKIVPYTESIFDESQFSAILDNSTLNNNNKNTINFTSSENEKIFSQRNTINYTNCEIDKISHKKNRSNSCINAPFFMCQDNNDNILIDFNLKPYFTRWIKKTIVKLLLKKKDIINNIFSAGNIIANFTIIKLYKNFMYSFKLFYEYSIYSKIHDFFDDYKIKIVIKEIKLLSQKYNLFKYFNIYKDVVSKKIIIQNMIKNTRYKKKKQKEIRKRNKQAIYADFNLGRGYYVNDVPYINYNTNYVHNKINLNNTNSCFIINNNYNNNTNKINIGMTYQTENNHSNTIENDQSNNVYSYGKIQSKIIEIPKNIYKQKKIKQSMALYNSNNKIMLNEDIIDNDILENCKILNYNTTGKKNEKGHKKNLSKSVILPNKISYFEPDLTTQKNQLLMVINIVERHRKSQKSNTILSYFNIWKNALEYNFPKINDNNNLNIRNKKNVIKNQNNNSLKNEKINFSIGTTDYEEFTKNTMVSDDFRIESDSKSENKISTKSVRIISSNKLYTKKNSDTDKGVYKKKTICQNKNVSFVKKSSFNINNNNSNNNNSELLNLNLNKNNFQINNCKLSSNTIPHNNNITFQSTIFQNNNENSNNNKQMDDNNINIILKKSETSDYKYEYTTPEEYYGFKKVNKIQEMEISFLPLKENKKIDNYDDANTNNNNNYINSYNNIGKDVVEYNEIEQKEVIVESNEEENDYDEDGDGDNSENIIQTIKNEFDYNNNNDNYRTICNFSRTINIEKIDKSELTMKNKSMLDLDGFF